MIIIRADANEYIASGHVMRCLSIADALVTLGQDVEFITSDEYAHEMIKKRGHRSVCLHNSWNRKADELDRLIPELLSAKPELLLVDSYEVDRYYLDSVHKVVKLAYLDDVNSFNYPADLVINYSIYAEDVDYPKDKEYLLGMAYTPLRNQFNISDDDLKKSVNERSIHKQILLTTGASDPFHVAARIIRQILMEPELQQYRIICVKGRFWEDPEIIDLSDKYADRLQLLENVENMADIMLRSSMAVSAGGSTLYELCACCVPTVTFSYADNQHGNVRGFAQKGIMEYSGDVRDTKDLESKIVKTLLTYNINNGIMDKVIDKMRQTKCRNGAMRLAAKLISFTGN